MKAKVLLIAAALLMFAAVSFGQVASVFPQDWNHPLFTHCNGDVPIPDGTIIYVYQDLNGTGPDATDPLAPLCPGDPCPQNTFNMNQFPLNGADPNVGVPGGFWFDYIWTYGDMPTVNRLYLRVYYPNIATWNTAGGVCYTSGIFGVEANISLADKEMDWVSCVNGAFINPCTTTPVVSLVPEFTHPTPAGFPQIPVVTACASLCAGHSTVISVGPVPLTVHPRYPRILSITGGSTTACDNCVGNGAADVTAIAPPTAANWTWVAISPTTGKWEHTITPTTEGCVTISMDFVLPVEMGNVTVTPLDAKAELKWNTRSETSVARFEVVRDGEAVGIKEATNTPTGAEYSFVDATAENGHIYTYELVVVGVDGNRDVVFSGKVAPNAMYAKPTEYALGQNFPNPFNPTTTISFDIVDTNPVTLMVYNANGQLVTTLLNNVSKDAGRYSLNFDASNLTSGLYFYTVKVGNVYTATKKMLLVK